MNNKQKGTDEMKLFKKPIYIGLALFLSGILMAGAVSNFIFKKTNEIASGVEDTENETIGKTIYVENSDIEEETESEEESVINNSDILLEDDETEKDEPEKEEFELAAPVNGKVMTAYSGGALVFSETLNDYRQHSGIDIHAPILEKVCASEDGVIKEIKNDRLLGLTIIIDHENGFETVYSNLSTTDMVEEGEKIKKGTVISGVGDTAISETGIEAHLHFELYKDGKQENPEEYIKF